MAQFLMKLYIWFYCSSSHFQYLRTANNAIFSVTFLYIILELCFFVFSFTSNNIFVSIMKSLQIPTSKMKCILITAYRYGFNHFLKVTVILNDFTVVKGFREIRNFQWKYDAAFLIFLFGQIAKWKWYFDSYITVSSRSSVTYIIATLEMLFTI